MLLREICRPHDARFRRQSCVIQCILIVIKLSAIGLVQKSVVKATSVSVATPSIFLQMSFFNCSLCPSTDLVTLCFDMLGHRGSHFLMNLRKPGRLPICKGRFSTAHNRARFAMQHFLSPLPRPYSGMHSSKVLYP